MKKTIIALIIIIILSNFSSCEQDNDTSTETEWKCGTHNGNQLWTGPQGGCYYYNSNSNKTYVDRLECNC